jgi:hypothetical protein
METKLKISFADYAALPGTRPLGEAVPRALEDSLAALRRAE